MNCRRNGIIGATVLAIGLAGPAQAASQDFTISTASSGVELTVLGNDVLALAQSEASVDATPAAHAAGTAASIGGTSVPGTTSAVDVTSGTTTDGANCAAPSLPAALGVLLTIDGLCSTSTGTATGLPTAKATAGVGEVSLAPAALLDALVALVLTPVGDNLAPVFEQVENLVDGEVQTQLEAACATAAVPLSEVQQIVENLPVIGGVTAPLVEALPDNNACSVLVQFIANAPQLTEVQATLDDLIAALTAALADLGRVEVGFGSTSDITAAGSLLTGRSSVATANVTLPSLDIVNDVLAAVLEGPVGAFIADIDALIGGLGANAPDVPSLESIVAQVLEVLDIPLLTDPAPLLAIDITGSSAQVEVDTAAATAIHSAKAGAIDVAISPSLAALLGVPATVSVAPGDEVVLFAGTPIETRLAVGNATSDETSARGEAVTLELFRTTQGGIILKVGETTASGTALAPVATPSAPAPLPVTGGGFALAGLATMGATLLRRRR